MRRSLTARLALGRLGLGDRLLLFFLTGEQADQRLYEALEQVRLRSRGDGCQRARGWRCADVCAGTGALGFEAASRGAVQVIMVEQHPAVLQHLHAACKQLDAQNVQIVAGDAVQLLDKQAKQAPGSVDVVFFDPPYAGVFQPGLCASAAPGRQPAGAGWACVSGIGARMAATRAGGALRERWRYLKAGAVHAHLLRRLPYAAAAKQPHTRKPDTRS